jgi:hypothetical protein
MKAEVCFLEPTKSRRANDKQQLELASREILNISFMHNKIFRMHEHLIKAYMKKKT